MLPRTPKRKPAGPRYYRLPSFGGLIFAFVVIAFLIFFLFRLG
jgi:hypothetical protein